MRILVLNCGSATVKFKLFQKANEGLTEVLQGMVEVTGKHDQAIAAVLSKLPESPDVVAHRVVHGGDVYYEPVRIDHDVLEKLRMLKDMAPLHNPPAIRGIEAAMNLGVPQVAAFDTAFHSGIPDYAATYAIPVDLAKRLKIRRYGFHGHSHQYVTEQFAKLTGIAEPTIVTLHLGNGASAAAIRKGRCVDTSMGPTPLEGLVMGSRPGDMDPAIVLRMLRSGMALDDVEKMLWEQSGLQGLAGEKDMRQLLARTDEAAQNAIEIFCYRVKKYIGAYAAALGGVEGLVFTGGIGEKSSEIRRRIVSGLEFLGFELDPKKNEKCSHFISTGSSKLPILVIPTNEELLIATLALSVMER